MTTGTFSPMPGAAPLVRQVAAQARMEARLMLRNGEQLLLAIVIPVIVLVGAVAGSDALDLDFDHPAVDVFTPGVLALAVMSTAFTSLAIATGFERRYGVIKRLGSSPLPRSGLLAGKVCALLAVEALQVVVLSLVAFGLGWDPAAGRGRRRAGDRRRHGRVRLARPVPRRRAPRRGDAGGGEPGLPAAHGRGRGGAARVGVRRLRRVRASGCRPVRWAMRCGRR